MKSNANSFCIKKIGKTRRADKKYLGPVLNR